MSLLQSFGIDYKERTEKAIAAFKAGKGILLVDDEDRENEVDLIYSAEHMTDEQMAFMIRECSGIVCLCMSEDLADHLELPLMVKENKSQYGTAFTISIEAKEGVTTGVSAQDRVTTIKTAYQANAKAEDLSSPGHIFPLRAKRGGVLERRGHTEGTVELAKMAGFRAMGVLCEVMHADGTMMRLPEAVKFAQEHDIHLLSIEDLAHYRENQK
ncbi:3,4-dihydroxy-2-butanone-4-phosphate synthase [Aureibacter tunicatorum]|uniref:3,4-dihydroxy-2-butanone 4-phosphate synthase n=1 Tax=Aureibacter tunicatorum TaxID=866807 RepID=A0AAE3XMR1_9BACT|nr:3,4-dihydroxy-2-butanone-4-phosphate synthase [Aureibacter tunicatorum]MDR6238769.1 3,4-dihydroxy 2-butanone 4-phosphate synthase [Aureibacter tunicatorum]BDD05300.1 3,4-dihydroxy-2-butanone 4-phosphate synthase [Aureibacter tunicatorum]